LRDELNQPLGTQGPPRPAALRGRAVALGGRIALAAAAAGAAALYWRGAPPPAGQVATIPFADVAVVEPVKPSPMPTPTPTASAAAASVYPPAAGGVSVVRNGEPAPARTSGPQIIEVAEALGTRLAPGPDKRLIENSKFGALPRVASDGARPGDVYARPFADTALTRGAPRIAIFVGGLGLDAETTRQAIQRFPAAVSLGVAPYGADLEKVAAHAREGGHEIWLQAPMEGIVGAEPGPHTLTTAAGEAANAESLHWLMGRFGAYVGVANYLGSKFTADSAAYSPVLAEIARRGLLYLDDGASGLSRTSELAPTLDLKAAQADLVADASPEAGAIEAALARVEDMARRRGGAIVAASALPVSIEHIARWAAGLQAKGFALAPVSALITARSDRAARANP
jgi:polysaccharide deacetylase 2 family uncharacterized protein YibQ